MVSVRFRKIDNDLFSCIHEDGKTHRICFASTHAQALKRSSPPHVGTFNLPFGETVGHIFRHDTGLNLFPNRGEHGGVWRSVRSETEFNDIRNWMDAQGSTVFMRDCLELSCALDFNMTSSTGSYTQIGQMEHDCKSVELRRSISELIAHLRAFIDGTFGYNSARHVCAVPPRLGKGYDLPATLVQELARERTLFDLTPRFAWSAAKGSIKDTPVDEKWAQLEAAGLAFRGNLAGEPVILIDDKYQSGTTLHFVASKLRAAGAGPIFGLCLVKTLRDSDNTS